MKEIIKISVVRLSTFPYSCTTTMTPMQVNSTLTTLTKSTYLSPAQAQNPNCKRLELYCTCHKHIRLNRHQSCELE